ncbi:ORF E152 [Sulfolobus virus Ragged Hills]|uniref:ORF E152 n=1 Tax=Sulfolobus virus Ragged Hills TaxID=256994 RepID=Q6TRV3_9VIRU|nr:ORF E152 [Sulfolobus virus Ragged Hills]AAR27908.1 ORF E152 [Sulfolobus virus Ragged Hills]
MVDLLDKIMKSKRTKVIGIRLPTAIYVIYEALDLNKEDIAELKQLLSAFIVTKAIEKGIDVPEELKTAFQNIVNKSSAQGNVVFNINISKSEAKSEVKLDISKLTEILNELESLLITIQKNNFNAKQNAYTIPPARWKELNEKIDSLKKLVN